jgi:hypothetical protein
MNLNSYNTDNQNIISLLCLKALSYIWRFHQKFVPLPQISVEVTHNIGKAKAKENINNYINSYLVNNPIVSNFSIDWNGEAHPFKFRYNSFLFTGRIKLQENRVMVEGIIPFALLIFKNKR